MTCKELIQYLSGFDASENVGIVVVDPEKRLHFITGGYQFVAEMPAILLETTESEPLDMILEEGERKCRVCGCTDERGCPEGCWWVEDDLCSSCAGKEQDDGQ